MCANRTKEDNREEAARLPMDRRQIDRLHETISRSLAGHDFKSSEETNRFLQKQLAAGAFEWDSLGPGPDATPLEQAQELFYQALDAGSRGKRMKMARQALEICEDCADAWLLLAEDEAVIFSDKEKYTTKALEAAQRVLGPEPFENCGGHFWGVHETRPYMRARAALAALLATRGRMDEAIGHWEAMLELNPNDNQGIRLELLHAYLEKGEQEKTAALFGRYPDDASCEMAYDRVIHHLASGDQKAARKALRQALKTNSHIPLFLLGLRQVPRLLPDLVTWGGEDEAGVYASFSLELWRKTAGALELLKSVTPAATGRRSAKQRQKGRASG